MSHLYNLIFGQPQDPTIESLKRHVASQQGAYSYILLIAGNPGVGKSFIANSLGANFMSDFSTDGAGITRVLQYGDVSIDNQPVLVLDVPGLFEGTLATTRRNAKEITKALQIGKITEIPLKIGIVIEDKNGRIDEKDRLLIEKIHKALSPSPEFLLIFNQVKQRNKEKYTLLYIERVVNIFGANTGVGVDKARTIVIEDYNNDESDMGSLIVMLRRVNAIRVQSVTDITVTENEYKSYSKALIEHFSVAVAYGLAMAGTRAAPAKAAASIVLTASYMVYKSMNR
ncbi:hypothetical protein BX616_002244 [Lobosporangium transversale]|uniref:G domain-containing protein n=1 Tax=Lobosporangium transversale TaxID=64571 RepID=A0A1Y2GG48_9FUNG|nr:hypothetical protein BCR41DRAFT_410238 [Lobosporangium transversale]KAF9916988.1 hypothetical protein BX616_002244 [Lobosporangium transversale]ORZ09965.1 hypothetical protein BCR41DRAFT_410238 [Lobosporangium transversale]|eukprot:XP_021879055.1 hypothetical protein BCR41DRAFT_410238 [Lobosporangium transversale]